jgi:hypothetical protein
MGARLVHWYNHEHHHSGIRYVSPAQRHAGQDGPMLAPSFACSVARHVVYEDARQRNPRRWSRQTRNWTPVGAVTLNPERDAVIRAATSEIQLSGSIGEPAFSSRSGNAQAAARNAGVGIGPRRADQSEPPGATRSAPPGRASMARMASTGPFPKRAPWSASPRPAGQGVRVAARNDERLDA